MSAAVAQNYQREPDRGDDNAQFDWRRREANQEDAGIKRSAFFSQKNVAASWKKDIKSLPSLCDTDVRFCQLYKHTVGIYGN